VSPKASPKNGFQNYGKIENGEGIVSHTQEQKDIISACLAGKNVFFTGGAGTGKSTLLLLIVEKLIAKHGRCNVFVTATTGLAACAVGGTTIHQFAGMHNFITNYHRLIYLLQEVNYHFGLP
jgi:DNA replication protein DnaC